jgi:N-succinyldiaminopimelate aminotransferase
MAERTLTISSAGKTFSVTGWKIGWLHGPAELVDAVATVKQYLTYVGGGPFQPAVAHGLGLPGEVFAQLGRQLQVRRDLLVEGLEAAGFRVARSEGGYFVIADATPLGFTDGAALCRELPSLAGVVAVPVQAFMDPAGPDGVSPLVRFACCKRPEVIAEAASRLSRLGRSV